MSDNIIPKGDTLWLWSDTLVKDGAPFVLLEGDTVTLEITHTKTGVVVERTAAFTPGTNTVSYQPQSEDVAESEILRLRWKIVRGGLVGHIPTNGPISLIIS